MPRKYLNLKDRARPALGPFCWEYIIFPAFRSRAVNAPILKPLRRSQESGGAAQKPYAMYAHRAVFAEVKVDPELGQIRATRLVVALAVGTIINPRLAADG